MSKPGADPLSSHLYNFKYPSLRQRATTVYDPNLTTLHALPTPYIQLQARLSQVWLNHWTLLLILVLVRLMLAAQNLDRDLEKGRHEVNTACIALEAAASATVSMPHYLASGTNALVKRGIDDTVSALNLLIVGIITALEAILIFFIEAFKGTYTCLLELAVEGAVEVVLAAVGDITRFVNKTLLAIEHDIEGSVTGINKAILGVEDIVGKAAKLLGQTVTLPNLNIPALDQLNNFVIPSSFETDLQKINVTSSLESVKNAAENAMRFPFELLKQTVNNSIGDYEFNKSLLPVPKTEQMTFCTDNGGLNDTFTELSKAVHVTYYVIVILLLVGALLMMVPHVFKEILQWRALRLNSSFALTALLESRTTDPIDLVLTATHPLQTLLGIKLASRFHTARAKNLARWFVAYATHPPAFFVFAIAIAALLACALQGILLRSLEMASPAIADDIGDISAMVVRKLSVTSALWANETNKHLDATQTDLNRKLFGWAQTSTAALNNTLNVFSDSVVDALNVTFGKTPLYTPVVKVFDCIILLKIRGIEKGLTWVHNEARIALPRVPNSTFVPSADETSFTPMFQKVGATTEKQVHKVLDTIIKVWRESIKQEAITAASLLAIWVFLVLLALARCLLTVNKANTASKNAAKKSKISRPHLPDGSTELPDIAKQGDVPDIIVTEAPTALHYKNSHFVFQHDEPHHTVNYGEVSPQQVHTVTGGADSHRSFISSFADMRE